jgi:hypothetical protein
MSGDINVQTFSGKVNITSNLLVGSSHLFVDTTNNRVGITTASPGASLEVNGNVHVVTDLTFGGTLTGNGSGLTNVNSDSGSWVNGSSSNIHLAVSTDNVGIGVLDPSHKLDVDGDINIASGSTLRVGGTPAVFSNWSVDGSDIYRSSGNVGIGVTTPGATLDVAAQHGEIALPMVHFRSNRDSNSNGDGNVLKLETGGDRSDVEIFECVSPAGSRFVVKANGDVTVPGGPLYLYGQGNPLSTLDSYWNYENKVALVMQPPADNGSIGILFMSKGNETSDLAYIMYDEDYGEAGVSAGENGALVLGCENDGTGSSDHVRVKSRLVVENDMSGTDDPTYAFQVKSSNTTSDLFAVHGGGAIGCNGVDTNIHFTIQSNKTMTINGSTWTSYCRWYRGSGNWYIGSDNSTAWNQNLYWFANINASGNPLRQVIMFENDQSKGTILNVNTFTGQHRNIVKGVNPTNIESHVGLIVSADNNENIKVNGGVERGLDAITINETIPYVSVTTKPYDKRVFGVISGSEDPESREDKFGRVTSTFIKEEGDDRIFINSLGEGAIWISNQNGPLTSCDYVTSSNIPGYGMKQDSEFLANYTVAKITMNCDFQATPRTKYRVKNELKNVNYYRFETDLLSEKKYNLLDDEIKQKYTLEQYNENVNILDEHGQLQWEDSGETEAPYKVRYLLPDGTQISEEEYTTKALANEEVYIAAFVGCTYHCG